MQDDVMFGVREFSPREGAGCHVCEGSAPPIREGGVAMSARRFTSIVLASLCTLAGLLTLGDAPALALDYHKYEAQIAGGGPMTVDGGRPPGE